jgi:hypothetical protein
MPMDRRVRAYLATIGQRGGRKSRRRLDPHVARNMVKVREARRAFHQFHAACFWFCDPDYVVTANDVRWVAQQLMENGGRRGWAIGASLCR